MAEINKKLVKYATEAKFEEHLTGLADKINPKSVVFIEDTGRIWTHGKYYDGAWAGISGKPTTFAPSAHTHGSITNDGKIGTSANRIIETTTGGALTHVAKNTAYNRAFGTGENQVAMGNHTHSNFTRTAAGFTPAPTTTTTTRYLREDGTWAIPPDTHWTTGIRAGASGTNANSVANDPFIKVLDNTTYRSQVQILGGTNITAKSDATGKITIDGTHNHDTVYVKKVGDTMSGSLTATSFVKSGVTTPQNYLLQADGGHVLKSSFSGSTHNHTLKLIAGASTATTNSTADVADPYIRLFSDNVHQGNIRIVGGTNVGVVSKNGVITLTSSYTNTTYSTGTLDQLNKGTDTTGRLQTAKLLNDWLNPKLNNKFDKTGGTLSNSQSYLSGNSFSGILDIVNTSTGISGEEIGPHISFRGNRGASDTGTYVVYGAIGAINTAPSGTSGGALVFLTKQANGAAQTPTEQMRIATGGNVGIGTTSPAYKLDVSGDVRATGTFRGSLTGNASSASAVSTSAENSSTASRYILFANSASGNQALKTDSGLKYVPSTNTISATFSGNLTGNVTGNITATTGSFSSALSANRIVVTSTANEKHLEFSRSDYNYITSPGHIGFITGGKDTSSANQQVWIHSNGNTKIGAGSSTVPAYTLDVNGDVRATGTFRGSLTGNAATATKLASINTTFTGTYPVTVNVSGAIYSHTGLTYTGSTGALTATSFIGNASSATKVNNKLILKFDTGTTENTNLYTYDGSAAKTIDIKAGSNVSLTKTANTITISSTNTNTTYSAMSVAEGKAGTATSSRTVRADYLKQIIQHYTGAHSSRANGLGASSNSIESKDTRSTNPLPSTDLQRGVWFDFKTNSAIGLTGASTYSSVITMVPYGDNSGNSNTSFRLAQSGNNLYFQNWTTVWGTWNKLWHSGNLANGTTSQYIRGDGSLATYANTTYSEITQAETVSTSSSAARLITGRRLKYAFDNITAANATNATNINTLADNSTNASRFILFSDAATGNQRAKTDTGLKYNPSTNTITATLAGNASSATKLATARNINGTSFNGSANITTANWGTSRTLTIGSTGKSVNGSANVSWSLAEIGAAPSSHSHNEIKSKTDYSIDGTTAQSTFSRVLQANFINSGGPESTYHTFLTVSGYSRGGNQVSFPYGSNGNMWWRASNYSTDTWYAWRKLLDSSNYNSYAPTKTGTGASGTWGISITGNAATASAVTLTADNASNATRYPLFVDAATGNKSPRTDTGFKYNPSTGALTSTTFIGALSGNASSATNLSRSILAGTGLSGGGQLNANRTLSLDLTYTDGRYVPYSGASKTIDTNNQTLIIGGELRKLASIFEWNQLTGSTFNKYTDVASYGLGNVSETRDIIITIPVTTTTVWHAEIDFFRETQYHKLRVGAYNTSNTSRYVITEGDSPIEQVKFCRYNGYTVIIVKGINVRRLQVNLTNVWRHHTNGPAFNNKNNYNIEFDYEANLSGLEVTATINKNNFTNSRTINGTLFDGSANITTANWGTARNIGIVNSDGTGTAVTTSVNGSGNINLRLPSTIKASLTGNASSATTASSATYASAVTLTADNTTNATRYPLFASAATGNLSPRTDTGFTYNPSTGILTSTRFAGSGASLTSLNATQLTTGTVPDARLSGTYTGFSHKINGTNTLFTSPSSGSDARGRTVFGLAEYRAHSSAATGAIVFIAPFAKASTIMKSIEIDGMIYSASNIIRIIINNYTSGLTKKMSYGTQDIAVRVGETADGKFCVILGDVATKWYYPHFTLSKAMFSHSSVADTSCYGWTTALVTSLTGYVNISAEVANSPIVTNITGTATALTTNAGSKTQPIYFSGGKPVATTYSLGKSVPSTAVFTDTHWTSGIRVGASGTVTNTAVTSPYIKVVDNESYREQFRLLGGSNVTITSDASKNITIKATDTNSVTGIRAGASGTTTNAAVASNPYIKVIDDSTYRSQIRLMGSGATTVKSDASGNITISSTNTNTNTYVTQTATTTASYKPFLLGFNTATISADFGGTTNLSYYANTLRVQPSSGNIISLGTITASKMFRSSDRSLKEKIKKINLSNADKINLIEFNWKSDNKKDYGVIAQDLEVYYPELVNTDDTGIKSVNYESLYAIKIARLEERIKELEDKLWQMN